MTKQIQVLVVDDAVLVRKVVTDVLAEDPLFKLHGTAANGKLALQRIALSAPDIIVLDFEMPEMDGLQTIAEVRKVHPKVPIVMFSALTESGARETLEALASGANDYVTKPSGGSNLEASKRHIRNELLPKLKALCLEPPAAPVRVSQAPAQPPTRILPQLRVDAVAIGVSTGGPNALAEVIPQISKGISCPVFITQHMPAMFTRMLAERLTQRGGMPVREAQQGMRIENGCAYLAPGGWHLGVERRGVAIEVRLSDAPPENSCRPAVDFMLRELVAHYGGNILSVILTGMGQDGKIGCEQVIGAGGIVLAQDQATSVVWGMPGAVTQAGLAHEVLPLNVIAQRINVLTGAIKPQTDLGQIGQGR
jgi:two-component system chemotaxis response regulator CheB